MLQSGFAFSVTEGPFTGFPLECPAVNHLHSTLSNYRSIRIFTVFASGLKEFCCILDEYSYIK
jgi:hypothetical protein